MTDQIRRWKSESIEPRLAFGAFIRYLRKQKGDRQPALAHGIGVKSTHVSVLEHGKLANPHERTVQALAQYLEVDKNLLYCLLGRWPFPKPDALDAAVLEKYLQVLAEATGYSKEDLGVFIIAYLIAS